MGMWWGGGFGFADLVAGGGERRAGRMAVAVGTVGEVVGGGDGLGGCGGGGGCRMLRGVGAWRGRLRMALCEEGWMGLSVGVWRVVWVLVMRLRLGRRE